MFGALRVGLLGARMPVSAAVAFGAALGGARAPRGGAVRGVWRSNSTLALGHLAPNDGATVQYRRLGRGPSSGLGKTSGRGQKGQKARGKVNPWFEGGQTPFFKRFPKTGFNRPNRRVWHELKLERIQDFWDHGRLPLQPGQVLDMAAMRRFGLVTGSVKDGVKILSNGRELYTVPVSIEALRALAQAIARIEELGHQFTARYFTRLGLRAQRAANHLLRTRGYVPLQARPTHRRDIEYYSNPDKRGYLLQQRHLLLDFVGKKHQKQKTTVQSALDRLLEAASTKAAPDFQQSQTISLAQL